MSNPDKVSLFNSNFIDNYLRNFKTSNIDGLELKKEIIHDWISRVETGNIDRKNETSIDKDFINDFFGDILGYNYRNPHVWNLEKELKTKVDGKKPDGALGYFHLNDEGSNVIWGIIELKDATTSLDDPQARPQKLTPVDQAQGYSSRFGFECKWVVLSDFKEMRLYRSGDITRYERFSIKELKNDEELKRFLFLLKKDHLISKDGKSKTQRLLEHSERYSQEKQVERDYHILDELYELLQKFDGLKYVTPNILANAKPFNHSHDYVWHYSDFTLQSANPRIYSFFKEIEVKPNKVTLSKNLEIELKELNISRYEEKIHFLIERLNDCYVFRVQAYEDTKAVEEYLKNQTFPGSLNNELHDYAGLLKTFDIDLREHGKICNCIRCSYGRLELDKVLSMLKGWEGTPNHYSLKAGYFHAILATNDYKTAYLIYKDICDKERDRKSFKYFIAKFNLLRVHNLIRGSYDYSDRDEVLDSIKSIDLDFIIHEMDIFDPDQRRALIEIKEETLFEKIENRVDELVTDLIRARDSFERSSHSSYPNYTWPLQQELAALLGYYSGNFILASQFTHYKKLCKKFFEGFLISYSIMEGYHANLRKFEVYHIDLVVFNLIPDEVVKLLTKHKIEHLIIDQDTKQELINKLLSFLQSTYHKKIIFSPSSNRDFDEALTRYDFKGIYENVFSNLFLVLSMVELDLDDFVKLESKIINLLKVDRELYHHPLKYLTKFIYAHNKLISAKFLKEILILANSDSHLTDEGLINSICKSIDNNHPGSVTIDRLQLEKAILNAKENKYRFETLIWFWKLSNDEFKETIRTVIEQRLDESFDVELYRSLIMNEVIDPNRKNYFIQYLDSVNKAKGNGSYELWKGKPELRNFSFVNCILLLYKIDFDLNDKRLDHLTDLSDWQAWSLNPYDFDYTKFKSEWLLIFNWEVFQKKFASIPAISTKVREELNNNYESRLAELYVKYLDRSTGKG